MTQTDATMVNWGCGCRVRMRLNAVSLLSLGCTTSSSRRSTRSAFPTYVAPALGPAGMASETGRRGDNKKRGRRTRSRRPLSLPPPTTRRDELQNIHQILATVLHLGNISFDAVYSDTDPAEMSSPPALLERGASPWGWGVCLFKWSARLPSWHVRGSRSSTLPARRQSPTTSASRRPS